MSSININIEYTIIKIALNFFSFLLVLIKKRWHIDFIALNNTRQLAHEGLW